MSNPLCTTEAALVSGVSALLDKGSAVEAPLSDVSHKDLKRRTAHGAVVSIGAQAATFVLRTGSMMILARLLLPKDFGLVGMVTAFTGFLGLFRDAGLSMATIQRASVSDAQTSTLFWINVAVGGMLAALAVAAAPILSVFYHEPRLFWVTVALCSPSVSRSIFSGSLKVGSSDALGYLGLRNLSTNSSSTKRGNSLPSSDTEST